MVTGTRGQPLLRHLWHHDLHSQWCGERLYYWRIGFDRSTFDFSLAMEQTHAAMHSIPLTSYAVYELFGEMHLLLRVWLPPTVSVQKLRDVLSETLTQPHSIYFDKFSVEQIVFHWLWPQSIDVDDARRVLSVRDIERLNAGGVASAAAMKVYRSENYLAPVGSSSALKFFMFIPTASHLRSELTEQRFQNLMLETLRSAPGIFHHALYRGEGFAKYLVTGRVKPQYFETISQSLARTIDAYTFTYVNARAMPLQREEQLRPPELQEQRLKDDGLDLAPLLKVGESHVLEFKGSAFLDVAGAVRDGASPRDSKTMPEVVIKTVTALLNGAGGKLVLGVFERVELSAEKLQQCLGFKPRSVGAFECVGVEYEYRGKGWEEYQRRLNSLIRRGIEPSPEGWYSINRVEFNGHEYAVVSIRRGADWFYAKTKSPSGTVSVFYGRREAESVPLSGIEMETYRRANPRSSGTKSS